MSVVFLPSCAESKTHVPVRKLTGVSGLISCQSIGGGVKWIRLYWPQRTCSKEAPKRMANTPLNVVQRPPMLANPATTELCRSSWIMRVSAKAFPCQMRCSVLKFCFKATFGSGYVATIRDSQNNDVVYANFEHEIMPILWSKRMTHWHTWNTPNAAKPGLE